MKVYLVGGAVRDQLLNYPTNERDWVVIGATPEQLLTEGYRQVGRDFPVFLHPKTGEEYSLARTERKSAPGYYGFVCDFNPQVSLEEDLRRRDITINAMAMDEKGQLIDPYNGANDLKNKLIRHVSPAFSEDPVRVLRVARFAARYAHLGFTVAPQTRALMYQMVKNKELDYLVPERVWQELHRSLAEKNPEVFISTLRECGALAVILPEIDQLFGVPNPPKYHAEVDSGIHSLLVLQAACSLTVDVRLRFAALVHDLGKAKTAISDWPRHHGHEAAGVTVIDQLCQRLRIPNAFRKFAGLVAHYHLLIHRLHELRPSTIVDILDHTEAFRKPQQFADLLLICKADAQGKGQKIIYSQAENWQYLRNECDKIQPQQFIKQGLQGIEIKKALYQQRVNCVAELSKLWKPHEK